VLNFTAIDLQLYKIFKITQVSFFGTHCNVTQTCHWRPTLRARYTLMLTRSVHPLSVSWSYLKD